MARHKLMPLLLVLAAFSTTYAQGVFIKKVKVRKASSFDWEHAAKGLCAGQSDADERLADYSATKQLYDLYGPRRAPSRALPLILYISPRPAPRWEFFEWTCRRQRVLFAAARGVGNVQHPAIRCRATLDVLGDVRRRYRVDPNRTYIVGYSSGVLIANQLAIAMPECFGGLMCMGQRVSLHAGPATLARAAERIDIVALCGGNELVGPEVELVDVPVARAVGFRAGSMVSRHRGHERPAVNIIEAAYKWLERGVDKRRQLARVYPSTRIDWERPFDHATWEQSLLAELDTLQENEPSRALAMARWLTERSAETELGRKASKVIAAIERNSDILDLEFENTETNKHNVATALCEGYERAAQDRRASLSRERRAGFAKLAIHYLEDVVPRPADYSHRVAALEKIIAKAD